MSRVFAVTALLLLLCACARQEPPPPPPAASAAPVTEAPPVTSAPAPSTQSETEQATHSQESGDTDTGHSPADASLEQIAAAPAATPLPPGKWQPGVNYTLLVPAQPTSVAPGKVEVMEVFWLACIRTMHCRARALPPGYWLKTKPAYVEFVRVPVIWQSMHRSHAHLYYTLEVLGRQVTLISKAFDDIAQQARLPFPPAPTRTRTSSCSRSGPPTTASAPMISPRPTTPSR